MENAESTNCGAAIGELRRALDTASWNELPEVRYYPGYGYSPDGSTREALETVAGLEPGEAGTLAADLVILKRGLLMDTSAFRQDVEEPTKHQALVSQDARREPLYSLMRGISYNESGDAAGARASLEKVVSPAGESAAGEAAGLLPERRWRRPAEAGTRSPQEQMSFEAVPRRAMGSIGSEIRSFPSLPSTNDYLLALQPPADGLVVVADVQTAGRGRGSHRWDATAGESLLFSFSKILEGRSATLPLLPVLVALSVCEAAESLGVEGVRTKWPNDVLFGEKKLCGILIESRLRGSAARVVVGIGVNVNQRSFPPDLAESATSLALILGAPVSRELLLGRILDRLNSLLPERNHTGAIRRYTARCSTIGRSVTFDSVQGSRTGQAVGVDEQGRLLIETGGRLVAYAGSEITHVRTTPGGPRPAESQY